MQTRKYEHLIHQRCFLSILFRSSNCIFLLNLANPLACAYYFLFTLSRAFFMLFYFLKNRVHNKSLFIRKRVCQKQKSKKQESRCFFYFLSTCMYMTEKCSNIQMQNCFRSCTNAIIPNDIRYK